MFYAWCFMNSFSIIDYCEDELYVVLWGKRMYRVGGNREDKAKSFKGICVF